MKGTPASRILRYEGEYDSTLPENVSIAQFILDYAKEYGDDEACVSIPITYLPNLLFPNVNN